MDPQACYERLLRAVAEGDADEAAEAHDDLRTWLLRGGFEPQWTPSDRSAFFAATPRI